MIKACSLASGSNGNSYFIQTGDDCFLIDAGISCKQIVLRLKKIGHDMSDIKGVFITHEHADHIRGLDVLTRKYKIPAYITKKTANALRFPITNHRYIKADDKIRINNTIIKSFSKNHDAVEPCSFQVNYKNKNITVLTDVGIACEKVKKHIKDSSIIFLETNYDEQMLMEGRYPIYLKKRISSDIGHLSNYDSSLLILEHASSELKHIFLSHISENNNTPELAYKTFSSLISQRKDIKPSTTITSRYKVSEIFRI